MTDNILSAVLTFSLLAGGTAAIGSEMFNPRKAERLAATVVTLPEVTVRGHRAAPVAVVTLPEVTITGRRAAPAALAVVTLPEVTITGRRQATLVAAESNASEPSRVQ